MLINDTHTKILIVGAGPSGLMMAAQLLRYGVQPIVIDSKKGPTDQSKAIAVQARSMEIYRQMGLVDTVLKNGKQSPGLNFNLDGKKLAQLDLKDVGESQTPFPFIHLYQQSKNERALLDYLTLNCCPVYWNTDLTTLKQSANQVEVAVQNGEQITNLTCDWVVGADGAHSVVRKQLDIPFNGDTYAHTFYLLDAELDNPDLDDDFVQLYMAKKGFSALFPMPEPRRFRIIGNLPNGFDNIADLKTEDVLPYLDDIIGKRINIEHNHWFTTYKLHHRIADRFREQRCFLIGDAAHIHSPVGGQGMNTGLQDAYNLAWKLAGVVNSQINPTILDSYALERVPVAKSLLKTTDRVFTVVMSGRWYNRLFRIYLLTGLIKFAWSKASLREAFFKLISQTGINYRDSAINLHLSQSTKVKAGDRLPYLKIFDPKREKETDLHAWCSKSGFTLIIFGKFDELFLFNIARWINQKYPGLLNFFYLPPSGKNVSVFNALDANPHGQKAIIVRPDMYIGFMNDAVDLALMDNYLQNVVGIIAS